MNKIVLNEIELNESFENGSFLVSSMTIFLSKSGNKKPGTAQGDAPLKVLNNQVFYMRKGTLL